MSTVVRTERMELPAPLRALADRDDNGDLVIVLAAGLSHQEQKDAAKAAACAARKAGWLGLGPLPGLLAAAGRHARPHPVHAVHAAAGSAAVITAAAVTLTLAVPSTRPLITRQPLLPAASARTHAHPRKSRRPPAAGRITPPGSVPAAGGASPGLLPAVGGLVTGTLGGVGSTVRSVLSPVEQLHLKLGLQAAGQSIGASVTPQPSPSLLPQVCVTVLGVRVCTAQSPAA